MHGILKGTKQGFGKTLAGSFILHVLVISLGLLLFNTGQSRTFFRPVYTVDLVAPTPVRSSAAIQKPVAEKPVQKPVEKPAPPPKPVKKEAVRIKETVKPVEKAIAIKPNIKPKVSLDEAIKKIAKGVKEKEDRSLVDSSIEDLKKKKAAESKYISSRLEELKKELDSGATRTTPSPKAAEPAPSGATGGVTRENLEAKYPAYFSQIHDRVQEQWSIYSEDLKDSNLSIIVSVRIDRSGKLLETHVEKSSGDARFDESLIKAIRKAEFPPLPHEFDGNFLETGFRFCPGCER